MCQPTDLFYIKITYISALSVYWPTLTASGGWWPILNYDKITYGIGEESLVLFNYFTFFGGDYFGFLSSL